MKGRTDKEPPDRVEGEQPVTAGRPGKASSRDVRKHGVVRSDATIDQVLSATNLQRAWKRVKANRGAPGIDAMSIDDFPAFKGRHWERIESDLRNGTYRPAPVRRVFIDKPDGTQRPLGIPTVLDRVIQQAIAQVLTPLYDPEFSDHSYGFRARRSAHQAVRTLKQAWQQKRRHAVDCDLKSFFDTVNHERLMARLQQKIGGGILLRLIGRYLRAGVVMPDGSREATPCGVPQGGPLSPLLANIVLDPLDKTLVTRGHLFARYADDFIVMVASAKAAQRVLRSLTGYVEGSLKLVVNQAKSRTAPLRQCTFLSFQVGENGKVVWSEKAKERFKLRIREITSRNRGRHVRDVIDELRRYVTGWMNYFGICHTYKSVLVLDKWLRRRVRLYYWFQALRQDRVPHCGKPEQMWKQPRTRRRHLIALGISSEEVKMATRSRKGYWRMSSNALVQRALSKDWLLTQGVPDMRSRWIAIHYGKDASVPPVV